MTEKEAPKTETEQAKLDGTQPEVTPLRVVPSDADPMTLTAEEEAATKEPANAGIRGQLKKLIRGLRDDYHQFCEGMHVKYRAFGDAIVKQLNDALARYHSEAMQRYANLDQRFGGLYKTLIEKVLVPLDQKVHNNKVNHKALVDVVAEELHVLRYHVLGEEKAGTLELYKAALKERLESRADVVGAEIMQADMKLAKAAVDEATAPVAPEAPAQEAATDGDAK